ncbi:MAG TPA: rhodanese-like domain-containing protein [Thermoleophilaceae bacterium]|nr:rhodanese-like domain-containing protein [Thermoleophilaceae bacterium]
MAREVTPPELDALGDVQFVDIRTPEERDAGRIPDDGGHIPFDELQARASELDRDRPVVFYCLSGNRSAIAADAFAASGFDAAHLAGGIQAWSAAGRPIEGEIGNPSGLPPR